MPSITVVDFGRALSIWTYSSLAVATLGIAPGLETAFRTQLGLSTSQVGLLFMLELGGMALASWPCGLLLERWGPRWLARAALAVWSAANLLSIPGLAHHEWLLACRVVAGIGAGTMMILALEGAGRGPLAQRALSAVVVAQLATGAALLAVLPVLITTGGIAAVFLLEALAGLFALALSPPFDALPPAEDAAAPAEVGTRRRDAWRVVSVTLPFNVAIGAIWSFVAEFAPQDRMPAGRVDDVLSAGTLLGIAAAATAGLACRRWSSHSGAAVGVVGLIAGTAMVALWQQVAGFLAGTLLLSFAWNFTVPFLMILGAPHGTGRSSMRAVNLSFAAGLATGPPTGGWLLQAGGPIALAAGSALGLALVLVALAACRPQSGNGAGFAK
jgi:MFS family permease